MSPPQPPGWMSPPQPPGRMSPPQPPGQLPPMVLRTARGGLAVAGVIAGPGDVVVVSARAAGSVGEGRLPPSMSSAWQERDRPGTAPPGAGLALVGLARRVAGGMVVGVNGAGLVAISPEPARDDLVARVLEGCSSLAEADALAGGTGIWAAYGGRVSRLGEDADPPLDGSPDTVWPAGIVALLRALPRAGEVVAAYAVLLPEPGAPVQVLLGLGPATTAVMVRHWPGIDVGPDATGIAGPAPASELAQRLSSVEADLSAGLAAAWLAALDEGEEAERMARIMDRDGDDRGAEVRRGVAQVHALDLGMAAQRRLLAGPALGRPGADAHL